MSKFPGLSHSCRRSYVAKLENWEFVFLIGNQRVGIFPPKSKILFSLRISFIWYRKIQDWPSPLGGVTWPKYAECWPVRSERRIIRKKNKEITRSGLVLPVEYLRNGKRYLSSVFTLCHGKSYATNWCNDSSVVVIVSEILQSSASWIFKIDDILVERNHKGVWWIKMIDDEWWFDELTPNNNNNKNEEITQSLPIRAMCFRSNISETVRDIRVLFSLYVIARVTLPTGTTTVL